MINEKVKLKLKNEGNGNLEFTMLSNSGPLTEMKLIPASLAMAFAKSVFPQPGGPQSKTPEGRDNPKAS